VTYSGGQRSAKKAAPAAPGNVLQGVADFLNRAGIGVSRSAAAAARGPRLVPLRSDQLPPGAFMKETGEVRGMSSEMVPKGGYMTETGRVYVPEGFAGFQRQGPPVPGRLQNAPVPPILPPPPTQVAAVAPSGNRVSAPGQGTTPIVQSSDDQYRQLLSQYGALTRAGEQEKAEKLGMEIWNKKYGKTAMAQPGGAVGAFNPLMQATFGYQAGASTTNPSYAGSKIGSEDFAVAANAVPAPWNQQGAMVDAARGVEFLQPEQAKFTTGEGMPAFQTTGEKAEEFLRNVKLGSLF
jgi:hypothetical protein